LAPVTAGYFTAACVFAGSFVRPIGGALADRIGGARALTYIYALVAAVLLAVSQGVLPPAAELGFFVLGMMALGMGNGAVFQLVPLRFGREVGLLTGLVGMSGGVGGFFLAAGLGYARQFTGSFGAGFAVFALLALVAFAGIARLRWPSGPILAGAS
jgi:NNP family nitrate/nitrite transporter-like MFS transporter